MGKQGAILGTEREKETKIQGEDGARNINRADAWKSRGKAPNTKIQKPKKLQVPNFKSIRTLHQPGDVVRCLLPVRVRVPFVNWILELIWILVFGFWILVFRFRPSPKPNPATHDDSPCRCRASVSLARISLRAAHRNSESPSPGARNESRRVEASHRLKRR